MSTAAPLPGPQAPKDAIRIRHVRFATAPGQGLIIGSPREGDDHKYAREAPQLNGYDIFLVEKRQALRFDYYADGKWQTTKWMHISQVRTWEEWDAPAGAPAGQSSSAA
jgi:hypothetical protein